MEKEKVLSMTNEFGKKFFGWISKYDILGIEKTPSNISRKEFTVIFRDSDNCVRAAIFPDADTKDDGTGTSYDEEGVMVISMSEESTVNLYAIWRAEMVEIECPGGYICYGSTFDDVAGTMNDGTYNLDTTSNIGYQSASDNADITLLVIATESAK